MFIAKRRELIMGCFHKKEIQVKWRWLLPTGFTLAILGICTIIATLSHLKVVYSLCGLFLILSGILIIIHAFKFWWKKYLGFILHLLSGSFYILIGEIYIAQVILDIATVTLILAIAYIAMGIFRIILGINQRETSLAWDITLITGMINLLLSSLILLRWPLANLSTTGVIIGVDLLFTGLSLFTLGFVGQKS